MITSSRVLRRAVAAAGVVVLAGSPAAGMARATEGAGLKPNQIVTIAGTGEHGYSGDGGDAADARLGRHLDIDVGPDGTVYIADLANDRLRTVDADGVIDTVTGTRARRDHERDVPVAEGWIFSPRNTPRSVAVGDDGTIYVAASENIYRIEPDGTHEVIGGGGDERVGKSDDGGSAMEARIYKPSDIAVDADGNVYIADTNNHRIRRIDTNGTITTIAGGGDVRLADAVGGPATDADARHVETVTVDSRGNVYFGQGHSNQPYVWKVDPEGVLNIAAGNGPEGYAGDGGPAIDAQLPSPPGGLAVDADDNLYLTDQGPGHVRMVDGDGVITAVGPVFPGHVRDVAVGPHGDLYVTVGAQVRMLVRSVEQPAPPADPAGAQAGADPWAGEEPGTILTVAGTGEEPQDPTAAPRPSSGPRLGSIAVTPDGALVYSEPAGDRVLRVDDDGTVSPVAGTGEYGFAGDGGPATEAELHRPSGVALGADGTLYIADSGNSRIRAVDPDGTIRTVAGSGTPLPDEPAGEAPDRDEDAASALGDGGQATEAVLVEPQDVTVGADGTLYIADGRNSRIRAVDPDGTIRTVAGGGDLWANQADGRPATAASLWDPNAVAVDADGNVYFTGDRLPSVRMVDGTGTLTTVAGDSYPDPGEGGFGGDGGPATEAELNAPGDVVIGPDGALYIADTFNSRVRRVDTDGVINTIAGTGQRRDGGDGGPAAQAGVDEPVALAFDADDNLYIAGADGPVIRRVDTDGVITTVADLADDPAPDSPRTAVDTPLGGPLGLAVDAAGALYVAETQTDLVQRVDTDGTIAPLASLHEHFSNAALNLAAMTHSADGFLYIAAGGAVHQVHPDGTMVTVAGGGGSQEPPETLPHATTATLAPAALASGPEDGSLYIADAVREQIYRLDRDGRLMTVADEPLDRVTALAVDGDGNVYVTEQFDDVVRKVAPDGSVDVFAGTGERPDQGDDISDGGPATEAVVIAPRGVAVDADGSVYISTAHGIRRVDSGGTITTVIESDAEQDGGAAIYESADMLAFDPYGNLYFSEMQRHRVRVVVRPGEISGGLPLTALVGVGVGAVGAAALAAGAVLILRRRRATATVASQSNDEVAEVSA